MNAAIHDEPTVPVHPEGLNWRVNRGFRAGGRTLMRGEMVAGTEAAAWRNFRALAANRFLEGSPALTPQGRFAISRGFGRFDVLEGRKVNAAPLTKEEAEELVTEGEAS